MNNSRKLAKTVRDLIHYRGLATKHVSSGNAQGAVVVGRMIARRERQLRMYINRSLLTEGQAFHLYK